MKMSRIITVVVMLVAVVAGCRCVANTGKQVFVKNGGRTVHSENGVIYENLLDLRCEYEERCISQADDGKYFEIIDKNNNYLTLLERGKSGNKYFRYGGQDHDYGKDNTVTGTNDYSNIASNGYSDSTHNRYPYSSSSRYNTGGTNTGTVHVKGYYRKDGTYVQPHTRSRGKK